MQSCVQSVSAPRGKAGARLNAHAELRAKRQRSAWEAIYRNRPIRSYPVVGELARALDGVGTRTVTHGVAAQVEFQSKIEAKSKQN